MQRLLASLMFCGAALFATAQNRDITVTETDAMRASASKHADLVHKTVTLNDEQRSKVVEIYMNYERQLDGLNQRMDKGGFTPAEREAEMAPQWANMEKAVDEQLSAVLTGDQMSKWVEARK